MISFKFQNGDFSLDSHGGLQRVTGVDSLKQSIGKVLMTDKENILNEGEIPFRYNPDYGTNLNYIKQLSPIFTIDDAKKAVQEEVRSVLLDFAKTQTTKLKYGLTQDEIMADATITVTAAMAQSDGPKRILINFEVAVVSASGKTTNLEIATSGG